MGHCKSKMARVKQKVSKCHSVKSLNELFQQENINANTEVTIEDFTATPLWFAVRFGDPDLVKLLLSVGASVNTPCENLATTALHIAAYTHNTEIAKILLDHGANPNVMDKWNYTPLMYAVIHYEPFVVRELLSVFIKCGCDVNYGATLTQERILERANSLDIPRLCNRYDETDTQTFVKEPMGTVSGTALHLAVQNPYLPNECIELLIEAGADVNKLNMNAQTPLMATILDVYYDYHSNVKSHSELLLSCINVADIDIQDNRGWTCLHYAAQRGSIPCMELVLTAGSDCNISGHTGITPLWLLLIHGWREAARYLLINGCDVNKTLHSICVLQINQDVEICRYGNILPIEFAVSNKYYNLAKLLIQIGCKTDYATCLGDVRKPSSGKHAEFLNFVKDFVSSQKQVQSLRHLCRHILRGTVTQGLFVKCDAIGLPHSVRDFLCYGGTNISC